MTQLASGSYRPGSSMLHGLDGAVKLISFVLLCAAVLLTDTLAGHLLNLIFCIALVYLAGMKAAEALRSIKRIRWPLILIIVLSFLFSAPEAAFYRFYFVFPSLEGLREGSMTVFRLCLLLVFSDVLSNTTPSLKINEAIRSLLRPLGRIGLPAERLALMLGMSARFIPVLFEQAEMIRKAQRARGVAFERKSFFDTARAAAPIAVPLVVGAFRKAETLSMAMEARGYRMDGKGLVTAKIRPDAGDWYALLVSFALFALHFIVL